MAISPYALVVHTSVPAKTLPEFIAYAKANPGQLSYSSAGVGSASHLAAELFKSMAGIEMVHVPNKGMNPALVDLMGGQVQIMFTSVPGMLTEKSDRIRPLAMGEKKRSALMPNCRPWPRPVCRNSRWATGRGSWGPPNWTRHRQEAARRDRQHLETPEMQERIKTLGFDLIASTPEEFGVQSRKDVERWTEVVKTANIPQN